LLWRQPLGTDTCDLDPPVGQFRVLMVVAATMDTRNSRSPAGRRIRREATHRSQLAAASRARRSLRRIHMAERESALDQGEQHTSAGHPRKPFRTGPAVSRSDPLFPLSPSSSPRCSSERWGQGWRLRHRAATPRRPCGHRGDVDHFRPRGLGISTGPGLSRHEVWTGGPAGRDCRVLCFRHV
jgi:hypothetical protein